MNIVLLLLMVAITNLPYKRSTFPHSAWQELLPQTGLFLCGSLVLLMALAGTHIPLRMDITLLILTSVVTIVWFLTPTLARTYGRRPGTLLARYPQRFLLRMELPIWTMKYTEILFQQVCFVYVFFLLLASKPDEQRLIWFTISISGIHLVNFFFRDARITALFFLFSIPMSILFATLLLHGYLLLTLTIHLSFYILFLGSYWFRKMT